MPPEVLEVKPDAVLPGADAGTSAGSNVEQNAGDDASLSSTNENGAGDSENLSPETGAQLSLSGIAAQHADAYAGFDPTIHATNADGTPKRKTDGSYALKRGRKAGTAAASALPPKTAAQKTVVGEPANNSPTEQGILTPDMAAQQHANMLINVVVWTLGEEVGKPTSKDESNALKISFKNYYEVAGVPNIPPSLGLVFGILAYVGPRLIHDQSISRFQKVKLWIAAKFGK